MIKLQKISIYYKINAIIIGILLLFSIIIGVIMIGTTERLLNYQMEKRGAEVATYIASLSNNDILLDDHYALFDRLNKAKNSNDDIRYILITDSYGRVLAHTFSGLLPQGLANTPKSSPAKIAFTPPIALDNATPEGYQIAKYNSNEGLVREIIVPIEAGSIGFVRVGMLEKTTQKLLNKNINEFFIITLILCSLASLFATRLSSIIIRPVARLAKATKEIERGNFSIKTEVTTEDEIGHLASAFNQMAATLEQKKQENNRLLEELRTKEALRAVLMNKLYTIQEEERKRISRELHDETNQSLASLLAYMKVLLSKLTDEHQKTLLLGARDVAVNVLEGLRKMAVELRPPILDDLGIIAAMEKYIQTFRNQHLMEVSFLTPAVPPLLSNEISLALYRILQESLTNIAKHAQATQVYITLSYYESKVTLMIEDNGKGISTEALEKAHKNGRLGIYGMKERAELLGGNFEFETTTGQGTLITVQLPMRLE